MKRITILLLLLATFLGIQAQTARTILDRTSAVVSNKSGATAKFTMSGKYGNASGTISIKGNKFCAHTSDAIIWYDGKTQWAYNKQAEEVSVSTPTEAQQQSMNPYKFINIYKNGFNLSSKVVSGKYQVHMVAQDQRRTIKELYILITKSYQPTQVKMRTSKGWTTINISNFRKANLSDTAFRFSSKDYPEAEVIDLR
ncbi:MAG: outer-membrane lipoprotein carrier protein LolA [Prevotella sp.]|nr:outer-membrane lipoprotein carrier protein LolA [Prevotella sp.]